MSPRDEDDYGGVLNRTFNEERFLEVRVSFVLSTMCDRKYLQVKLNYIRNQFELRPSRGTNIDFSSTLSA